jgi:hypothetical protein
MFTIPAQSANIASLLAATANTNWNIVKARNERNAKFKADSLFDSFFSMTLCKGSVDTEVLSSWSIITWGTSVADVLGFTTQRGFLIQKYNGWNKTRIGS